MLSLSILSGVHWCIEGRVCIEMSMYPISSPEKTVLNERVSFDLIEMAISEYKPMSDHVIPQVKRKSGDGFRLERKYGTYSKLLTDANWSN